MTKEAAQTKLTCKQRLRRTEINSTKLYLNICGCLHCAAKYIIFQVECGDGVED